MKLHACMQRALDSQRQVRHHLSVKCLFLWQPLFWGPCWQGSLSSQFTTLTACMTDSEPQICTESCLDNCQLSLSLTAIKDEGSFFSISPWLPSRRLSPKCREMASSSPSHKLVIDGSFLSDSDSVFILYGGACAEKSKSNITMFLYEPKYYLKIVLNLNFKSAQKTLPSDLFS